MGTEVRLAHGIELPWRRTVVVADAHVLMRTAARMHRFEESPLVLRLAKTGRARILVAPHIPGEVVRRLPRLARHHDLPADDLVATWWSTIAPHVDVVELPSGEYLNPRLRSVRTDTDDVPTAALALLVAPCVIWSEDHSLVDSGLAAASAGSIALALATREADWAENTAVALFSVNAVGAAIAGLLRAAARHPGVAAAGIVGLGLLGYVANLPDRFTAEARARWARSLRDGASDLLDVFGNAYADLEATRARLPLVLPEGGETPEEAAARVLAQRTTPLPLRQLYDELHLRDATSELLTYIPPSMAALRRQLTASATFVRSPGDRWSIGLPANRWAVQPRR